MKDKKLVRSKTDRIFAGVAGGMAQYFEADATLVRLGFVALGYINPGLGLVMYGGLYLLMPEEEGEVVLVTADG